MGSETALEVILPVARVSFVGREPVHNTVTIALIVLPVTLVVVVAGVGHLPLAPLHATLPLALVNRTVFVVQLTVAVAHSVLPGAVIFHAFLHVDVLALAMAQSVQHFALVGASVAPLVGAFASDLVLLEFTLVDGAISPLECASAVQEPFSQLTFVLVAIFELAGALTVVYLANLQQKGEM